MEHLASQLADKLAQWQIVKEEDKELYAYGFWQGGILLFNFATVAVAGLLFGMLWQSVVFTAAYGLLRTFAGGYHARSQRNCYLFSLALIMMVLCAIKPILWDARLCVSVSLTAAIMIFVSAPVEDPNKPLDGKEQIVFRKRTRFILLCLLVSVPLFLWLGEIQFAACLAKSFAAAAAMLVLGKTNNLFGQN